MSVEQTEKLQRNNRAKLQKLLEKKNGPKLKEVFKKKKKRKR